MIDNKAGGGYGASLKGPPKAPPKANKVVQGQGRKPVGKISVVGGSSSITKGKPASQKNPGPGKSSSITRGRSTSQKNLGPGKSSSISGRR